MLESLARLLGIAFLEWLRCHEGNSTTFEYGWEAYQTEDMIRKKVRITIELVEEK